MWIPFWAWFSPKPWIISSPPAIYHGYDCSPSCSSLFNERTFLLLYFHWSSFFAKITCFPGYNLDWVWNPDLRIQIFLQSQCILFRSIRPFYCWYWIDPGYFVIHSESGNWSMVVSGRAGDGLSTRYSNPEKIYSGQHNWCPLTKKDIYMLTTYKLTALNIVRRWDTEGDGFKVINPHIGWLEISFNLHWRNWFHRTSKSRIYIVEGKCKR